MAFLTETEKAYAAGIFDGEGSVSLRRHFTKYNLPNFEIRVEVSMTCQEVPLWMHLTFGGRYEERNRKTLSGKQVYRWQLIGKKAVPFLQAIIPFLRLKRVQAELALELIARMRVHGGSNKNTRGAEPLSAQESKERERIALQLRSLNSRSRSSVQTTSKWGVN